MKNSTLLLVTLLSFGLLAQSLAGCGRRAQLVSSDNEPIDLAAKNKGKGGEEKTKGPKPEKKEAKEKAGPKSSGGGFILPQDAGGKILAQELPPHRNVPPLPGSGAARPRRHPAGEILETAELPLPPIQAELPLPLDRADAKPPAPGKLPVGRRIRLPLVDVNEPLPLPLLGQAVPDRAPLTDPTADISRKAALAGSVPPRTTPVPFLRLNLPDPFEHQQVIRLKKPPEEALPKKAGSQLPGKGGK